jgi:hypothetical protein
MKRILLVLTLVALSLTIAAPAFAMEGDAMCAHDDMEMHTIESLHHCVHHAVEMGHITKAAWAASLHAKLDAAQAALDRGQTNVAVNMLNAFIKEVNAQSGVLIVDPHGEHLAMHAQMVIDHLLH